MVAILEDPHRAEISRIALRVQKTENGSIAFPIGNAFTMHVRLQISPTSRNRQILHLYFNIARMSEIADTTVTEEVVHVATGVVDTPVAQDNDEHSSSDAANGNDETEDQQLKRKRDEGDDDAEISKRAAVAEPTADTPASAQPAAVSSISASGDVETISIAPDKVGQIIGTKVR